MYGFLNGWDHSYNWRAAVCHGKEPRVRAQEGVWDWLSSECVWARWVVVCCVVVPEPFLCPYCGDLSMAHSCWSFSPTLWKMNHLKPNLQMFQDFEWSDLRSPLHSEERLSPHHTGLFCLFVCIHLCHQFLQYFILYQLWIVDLKHVPEL